MPVYKAEISYRAKHCIEFEAMGDAEAGEVADDLFSDMDKGSLGMDDIEVTDITVNRMGAEDIAEHMAENRGQI